MIFVYLLLVILLAATVHATVGSTKPRQRVVEVFLLYLLVGYYGGAMLLSAYVHLTNWASLDAYKRWPPAGQQMHTLYAFALIGLAAASFLGLRFRNEYLLAPAITGAGLSFGGAYVHIGDIARAGRFVVARDGLEILFDVLVPLSVLALAISHVVETRRRRAGA